MRSVMICHRVFLAGCMALALAPPASAEPGDVSTVRAEPADVSTETSSNSRSPFHGVLRFMAPQSASEADSARRGTAAIQTHRGTIHASRGWPVRARYSYRGYGSTRLASSAHWRFERGDSALRSYYSPYWYPRPAYYWYPRPAYPVNVYPNVAYPSPGYNYYYQYPYGYPYRYRYYYPGY
jgi:hypothetical protein